jgi:hypothetical protein
MLAISRALTKAEQLATYFRFFSAAGGSPHSTSYCDHTAKNFVLAWQQNQYCLLLVE